MAIRWLLRDGPDNPTDPRQSVGDPPAPGKQRNPLLAPTTLLQRSRFLPENGIITKRFNNLSPMLTTDLEDRADEVDP